MMILSKRLMSSVSRKYWALNGLRPYFMDLNGGLMNARPDSAIAVLTKGRRNYGLQESVNIGQPYIFSPVAGVSVWVLALEDRRRVLGGAVAGDVITEDSAGVRESLRAYLQAHGADKAKALRYSRRTPVWNNEQAKKAAWSLQEIFYSASNWQPVLMDENRLRVQQKNQLNQAIEDGKRRGEPAVYEFEKERVLLANIRAGDRNEARKILNEMLAAIYLSSPQMAVLRARAVQLMSYLTRAAIEDNPLLESLISRNHTWTERLIRATGFEELSQVLMEALDDFTESVYLHGVNRANLKVSLTLDFIRKNFTSNISLKQAAAEIGLSVFRLAHLMKEFTGRTFLQNLFEIRMRQAQQLLNKTSKSCAEVAYEVGFGDQSSFIKYFKRFTGITPARYRRAGTRPG